MSTTDTAMDPRGWTSLSAPWAGQWLVGDREPDSHLLVAPLTSLPVTLLSRFFCF